MKGIFERENFKITAILTDRILPFPPMFHYHAEIIALQSGSVTFVIDGIEKVLTPGDISFTFPYSIHEYKGSPTAKAILLLFSPEITGGIENSLLNYKPSNPYISDDGSITPLLKKALHFSGQRGKIAEETAKAYLCAAIGEILSGMDLQSIEVTDVSTTQKILIYCARNYKKHITQKTVSKDLFVSQSQITRIFKTKLNCSFRDYINLLRVTEAKNQLENTGKKIIEIMYECGFKNQSSFNRIFYETCNMTPSEYRKKARPSI